MANSNNSSQLGNSGTFVYTPDISVAVSTLDNGIIDISADIINFTLDREINQVSTFTATLNNPGRKYVTQNSNGNRLISTMDRITVFLKRTNFIQCFTGYITYAPLLTLQPVPVTITANCTLRILQTTYWDNTLITFQTLLLNQLDQAAWSTQGATGDGGVAQAVVNVLHKVCGWNPGSIHIQSLPSNFISFAATTYIQQIAGAELSQNALQQLSQILSVQGISNGRSVSTGLPSDPNSSNANAPTGVTTNATVVTPFITGPIAGGQSNYPGKNTLNPVDINSINEDIYYCSAPWGYLQYQITPSLTTSGKKDYQKIQDDAKSWLANNWAQNTQNGRLLLLHNNKTNKAVAVRATSIPQKADVTSKGYAVYDPSVTTFQCHPGVVAYLNNNTSDPNSWTSSIDPGKANVFVSWADMNKINKAGVLPDPNSNLLKSGTDNSTNSGNTADSLVIVGVLQTLVKNLLGQVGDVYTENTSPSAGPTRSNPGKPGTGTGSFDCSGLAYWGYSTIGIQLGGEAWGDTWTECGPTDGSKPEKYGAWTPNTTQPQVGDLIFWEVSGDGGSPPQHVSILISDFGATGPQGQAPNPDVAYLIEASHGGYSSADSNPAINSYVYLHDNNSGPNVQPIYWSQVKNGKWQSWGGKIIGFRSPITLHPAYTAADLQKLQITQSNLDNIVAQGTGVGTNPSTNYTVPSNPNNPSNPTGTGSSATTSIASGTAIAATLNNAYSNLLQPPQFDIRAGALVSTPRAFLLDNPVMNDITQIMGAGLRSYQSAPNGDFVAWFPDYYGIYGTDPVLEISPVEIIDFQIYHDDNQLTTHVGVVGDTSGVGSQVSDADYLTTNGIVSVQDGSTMQMLFGKTSPNPKNNSQNNSSSLKFLNKYGMRPYVQEQQMLHSHSLEYMYALYTFMNQWANQFASSVTFTFMPELYPGMRIVINMPNGNSAPDVYEFYCMSVTHTGDRSGGFTTQATLGSPKANGKIMHYGLGIAQ